MPSVSLPGLYNFQYIAPTGTPAEAYRLYTYAAGTTTHKIAYTDSAGTVAHTYTSDGVGGLYIPLDSRGELPAPLWLQAGGYDLTIKTPAGVSVWTRRAIGQSDASAAVSAALAAVTGSSLIGYSASGGVTRTVQDRLRDSISVLDFGADPTGVADSSTAFQAAIAAAETLANSATARGCAVFVPSGVYLINTQLVITENYVGLVGDGCMSTALYTTDTADASILKFEASGSAPIYGNFLEGLRFQGRGLTSGGRLLDLVNTQWGYFKGLRLDNGWDALYFQGGNYCFFDNLQITVNNRASGTTNTAITLIGGTAFGVCADVHFTNLQIWPQAASANYNTAISLSGTDGVYITNAHIQGFVTAAILIAPTSTSGQDQAKSLMCSNVYFDSADAASTTSAHVVFQGQTLAGEYEFFQFSNCMFRGSKDDAVRFSNLSNKPDIISFTGCQFRGNSGTAIKVDEVTNWPTNVTVSGCLFSSNNADNLGSNGDLLIRGQSWTITGCHFEGGGALGYAVDLRTEADKCSVTACDFRASTAGLYRDTGTNNKRAKLYGVTLMNRGTGTIASGSTSVVITHGLAATPLVSQIDVRPSANTTTDPGNIWVDTITATQFTVNCRTNPGAGGMAFGWAANIED